MDGQAGISHRSSAYQVADKGVASVLVELQQPQDLEAGLVAGRHLGLHELAQRVWRHGNRSPDARHRFSRADKDLKLATTVPFLSSMQATQLPFAKNPWHGRSHKPSTSVKLPGAGSLAR